MVNTIGWSRLCIALARVASETAAAATLFFRSADRRVGILKLAYARSSMNQVAADVSPLTLFAPA